MEFIKNIKNTAYSKMEGATEALFPQE